MLLRYLKRYNYFIVGFLVFSVVALTLFYNALKPPKRLPIYSPAEVNPELVDTSIQHVSKYHTIGDFSFVNQYGDTITQKDFENKVYIADFFFTTCPTICPVMTKNMSGLQQKLMQFSEVKLLSHTVMPHIDSIPVLKAYGEKHGAIKGKWHLVTGDKKDIYSIARKSYMVVKTNDSSELYDMVHTENFVLVDTKKRVRGYYDGTNMEEMKQLLEDVEWLIQNPNN